MGASWSKTSKEKEDYLVELVVFYRGASQHQQQNKSGNQEHYIISTTNDHEIVL